MVTIEQMLELGWAADEILGYRHLGSPSDVWRDEGPTPELLNRLGIFARGWAAQRGLPIIDDQEGLDVITQMAQGMSYLHELVGRVAGDPSELKDWDWIDAEEARSWFLGWASLQEKQAESMRVARGLARASAG